MPKKYRTQSGIVSWLAETVRPIFVLDHRSRVRFFNRGCIEITGCQPDDIIGKVCEYRTASLESLSERVLHSLTPPAEVFDGQELFTEINFIDSGGIPRSPHVLYSPLYDSTGDLTAVMGTMSELRETVSQLSPSFSQQLHTELAALVQRYHLSFDQATIIAQSPAMRCVANQIQIARSTTAPVHVRGESGTGKSFISRMIHQLTQSHDRPLLSIQCKKLPRSDQRHLLKDALTHAGELSAPGAIFLKDVEHLSLDLQVWLAEMFKLKEWPAQYRLFSSTTLQLSQLVEQDRFDKSFYYAISPFTINLPSLTERQEDFNLLCQYFVEQTNQNSSRQLTGLTREVLDEFQQYSWPGNLRELKQVIEEACELSPGPLVTIDHLPFRFQTGKSAQQSLPVRQPVFQPLSTLLEQVEKEEIIRALKTTKGNKAKAAELLGLTRAKLYRRLESLGILEDSL